MLLPEQNMHFYLGIASDAVVIDRGHMVYRENIAARRTNADVRQHYLVMEGSSMSALRAGTADSVGWWLQEAGSLLG